MDSKSYSVAFYTGSETSLLHLISHFNLNVLPRTVLHARFVMMRLKITIADFVKSVGSSFELVPPLFHRKQVLGSKLGITSFITFRLPRNEETVYKRMETSTILDFSNCLYESEVLSANELPHGFTKPLISDSTQLHNDLIEARDIMYSRPELTFKIKLATKTSLTRIIIL